jgi:hypothetical protein
VGSGAGAAVFVSGAGVSVFASGAAVVEDPGCVSVGCVAASADLSATAACSAEY